MKKVIATLREGKNYSNLSLIMFLFSILTFIINLFLACECIKVQDYSNIVVVISFFLLVVVLLGFAIKFNNQGKRIKKYMINIIIKISAIKVW